jgi:asparagine synthase (glutamine-hydrolysing)
VSYGKDLGAIFGIVGEGCLDEVRAMGARMPHRGAHLEVWSPARGVYFGERRRGVRKGSEPGILAIDCQLEAGWLPPALSGHEIRRGLEGGSYSIFEALLEDYGVDGLAQVRGYFSLAYWDDEQRNFLIACDHVGFKSVYYAQVRGRFVFASEYKALLACADLGAEPNREALQMYQQMLRFPPAQTFLAGVRPLPAGTAAICGNGKVELRCYWRPVARTVKRSGVQHSVALRETMLKVIERQCRPYSRIGITLGNGFDSASLVAAIRHVKPAAKIVSYTIGNDEEDAEIQGARTVASHFKTEHIEVYFSVEMIPIELPRLIWLMEDCAGREEALFQLLVLSRASGRERVVMGGHGADMLFGGMPRHRLLRLGQVFPWLKTPIQELFIFSHIGTPPRSQLGRLFKRLAYKGKDYPFPEVVGAQAVTHPLDPPDLDEYLVQNATDMSDAFAYLEPAHEWARHDFWTPFMDPEVVETALSIPTRYKVGLRQQKIVLRQAMSDLLPDTILHRRKAIQRARHDVALSDVLDSMAEDLLSPSSLEKRGLLDPSYVTSLRSSRRGVAYSTNQLHRLWAVLSMEIWARQYLDDRGKPWCFEVPHERITGSQHSL